MLEKYIKEQYPDYALDFKEHILARIKDMMIDSFLSVKSELNACKRKNCFELLGFDFMIDEDFRVWLIEVNTNPYLGVPNKYIDGLLSKMLTDLFALVLDPSVKPANDIPATPNLYELLYDDRRKVNQRRSFNIPIYPIPELAQPQIQQMSLLSKIKRKKTQQNTVPSKPKKVKKVAEKPSKVQEEPKPKERVPIIIPIKPRKRLVDEAKELSEQFDEVRFGTYSKRVLGCFSNWDLIPQMDIIDTSNSILILIGGKAQEAFISSPLFSTLCRSALDFNKEMPREIRRVLFDKIVLVSQELRTRGHLVQKELVQGLIEISLLSCEVEDKIQLSGHIEDDRYFIKEAFRTLYNLAYFDRPRLYIPGETKMHNYNRKKTISWGCLSALYYIKQNFKNQEIKEFCENTQLRDLEISDLEAINKALTGTPEAHSSPKFRKESEEQIAEAEPTICFSENLNAKLKNETFLSVFSEELHHKKQEIAKRNQEVMQLRMSQKGEEAKKKEEEEKAKKEKTEAAFQEYIKRIEQRRKEKLENEKKELEEKENKLKEEEERRKQFVEMLQKKEEERRQKRIQELRKRAEIERKEAEELEKKQQEHLEKQINAFLLWEELP